MEFSEPYSKKDVKILEHQNCSCLVNIYLRNYLWWPTNTWNLSFFPMKSSSFLFFSFLQSSSLNKKNLFSNMLKIKQFDKIPYGYNLDWMIINFHMCLFTNMYVINFKTSITYHVILFPYTSYSFLENLLISL